MCKIKGQGNEIRKRKEGNLCFECQKEHKQSSILVGHRQQIIRFNELFINSKQHFCMSIKIK